MLRCARPARVGALAACASGPVAGPRAPSAAVLPRLCAHRSPKQPMLLQRRALGAPLRVRCVARTYATKAPAQAPPVAPRKCTGCGVKLQTEKEKGRGFVPLAKFETTVGDIVCYRCWGMRHHNKLLKAEVHDLSVIEKALEGKKCTLIKLIDVLDVHGSFVPNFSRLAAGLPVVVIGNKFDLMPNGAKPDRVRQWLKAETTKLGLSPAQVSEYLLLSAKTGEGFTQLKSTLKQITARDTGKDIFVVGSTNVGKSSFINRLMDRIERKPTDLTVSHFPGTTLDILSFPLTGGATLHDTPGVQNTNHIVPLLTPDELFHVLPRKCLHPITYRLLPGKTLFVGGLARVDLVSTSNSAFCYLTLFVASDLALNIHATRTERAKDLYAKHLGKLLQPPFETKTPIGQENAKPKPRDFPPLEPHRFAVKGTSWTKAECDITLGGAGWISVTLEGEATLDVHLPYPVKPIETPPLMPFELEDRKERRIRKHGKLLPVKTEERKFSEPADIERHQHENDLDKARDSLPVTLKRWKPRR